MNSSFIPSNLSTLLLHGFHHPTMYIYPLYIYTGWNLLLLQWQVYKYALECSPLHYNNKRREKETKLLTCRSIEQKPIKMALNNFHNLFKLFFFLTSSFFLSRAGLMELISPSPFFGYTLEGLKTCESTMLCPPSMFPSPLCSIFPEWGMASDTRLSLVPALIVVDSVITTLLLTLGFIACMLVINLEKNYDN